MSTIVKVASRFIELPLESVSVKVTVSVPVATQSSLKPELSFVTVTTGQLSVPVKVELSQLSNSVIFPLPSHSTVKSLGGVTHEGSSVSLTVTVNEQEVVLPEASVTSNVLVVVPTGNSLPLCSQAVCINVSPGQLSFVVTE